MESRMDTYEDRMASFTNWSHGLVLRPAVMAAAGFYHSNWDTDQVTCFHCNISLEQWDPRADPFRDHLRASPQCTFANKSFMSTLEERLASFHTWPIGIKPLPIHMAAAGFYHSNRRTDAVSCFCCTLRLQDWKKEDDPIMRHAEYAMGRKCAWVDKIMSTPDQVPKPVPKRAAPMWDHKKIPRKCGECRKVFPSGNQFQKHMREAHRNRSTKVRKEPRPTRSGPGNGSSRVMKEQRPSQRTLGVVMLGRHRVTKSTGKVRMPRRKISNRAV